MNLDPELLQELIAVFRARWDYGFNIVQGTGYLLDPMTWDCDGDEDAEIMDAFLAFVDVTYYLPKEPGSDATSAVVAEFHKRVAEQKGKRLLAVRQYQDYKYKRGLFAREGVIELAKTMTAADWWALYGVQVPELQLVAMRATAACSSASGAEHGHKEMNWIMDKSRNRMHFDKVNSPLDTCMYSTSKQLTRKT
jgi:hypothetical protein